MRKQKVLGIAILVYFLSLQLGIGFSIGDTSPKPASYQYTVDYGEYCYLYNTCNNYIDWSFSGSNTFVGLEAWIFNEENFEKFENGEDATGYEVSAGSYYSDSGSQSVNDCDVWYLVVSNADPDQQTTVITVDAVFYGVCDPNAVDTPEDTEYDWDFGDLDLSDIEDPKTLLIIILIVVVVILVIVVILKSKK